MHSSRIALEEKIAWDCETAPPLQWISKSSWVWCLSFFCRPAIGISNLALLGWLALRYWLDLVYQSQSNLAGLNHITLNSAITSANNLSHTSAIIWANNRLSMLTVSTRFAIDKDHHSWNRTGSHDIRVIKGLDTDWGRDLEQASQIFNSSLGLFDWFSMIELLLQTYGHFWWLELTNCFLSTLGLENLGIRQALTASSSISWNQHLIRTQVRFLLIELSHIGQEVLIRIIVVGKRLTSRSNGSLPWRTRKPTDTHQPLST